MTLRTKKFTTLNSINVIIKAINDVLFGGDSDSEELEFSTEISLDYRPGRFFASYIQDDEITFSEGTGSVNGGTAILEIIASGDPISFPPTWIARGDALNLTPGKRNTITVVKIISEVFYSVMAEA